MSTSRPSSNCVAARGQLGETCLKADIPKGAASAHVHSASVGGLVCQYHLHALTGPRLYFSVGPMYWSSRG
eukprot:2680436-Prymnesium_polylepis.1